MPITTNRARLDDIPVLVEMMREFYAESSHPLDAEWATRSFSVLLSDDSRGAAWIALREDRPAGYVVLTLRHSMEFGGLDAFVDDLFVRPGLRRIGVGQSLLNALFGDCRRRHVLAVHVEAGSDSVPAHAIYRRYGMRANGLQLLTVRISEVAP